MDTTKSVLDRVCNHLLRKGDEFELVASPDNPALQIGVAYVQYGAALPASFLFTEEQNPQTLILDVLFAAKVPEDRMVETSLVIGKLNEFQKAGNFRLDSDTGYVYFRQASVIEGIEFTDEQFEQLLSNMEKIGMDTAAEYAQELKNEFPE